MQALVAEVRERWQDLVRRIAALDAEFAEQARSDKNTRRLTTIPGIGALNATALVAAIGDVTTFARGRDLAAQLGLVPRQVTTGGKPRLVGITKRGSRYLRKTLVQGARAALPSLQRSETHLGQGLRSLLARSWDCPVFVDGQGTWLIRVSVGSSDAVSCSQPTGDRQPSAEWRRRGLYKPSMQLKHAIRASACEWKRRRASNSHSRVAKKLSAMALSQALLTEPIDGRTPASRHRLPKARDVHCEP